MFLRSMHAQREVQRTEIRRFVKVYWSGVSENVVGLA